MNNNTILVILVLLCFSLTYSSQGIVVNLFGSVTTDDATIYSNATADNGGGGVENFAGRTNTGAIRRLLIKFDVSSIPPSANISSVTLHMNIVQAPAAVSGSIHSLFRVLNTWSEGSGVASGGSGQLSPGGVTWAYRQYSSLSWTSAGGDFSTTTSASIDIGLGTGAKIWSSSQMSSDVLNWANGTNPNNGWILIGDESVNQSARVYGASEDAVNTPILTVVYTPTAVEDRIWNMFE